MSQRGLLTIAVSPKQAARAIRAAYGEKTYRAGGEIFQDTTDGWFRPIGILKFAGTSPAEPFHTREESTEMSVKSMVQAAAKKVANVVVGPPAFSDKQVEQFRNSQKLAADLEPARLAIRELQTERARIGQAIDNGDAEVDGKLPSRAKELVDQKLAAAHVRLQRTTEARDALVGLCPSVDLQRQRRQWSERNRQLGLAASSIASRLGEARRQLRRLAEQVEAHAPNRPASEAADLARQLASSQRDADELREEADAIAAEQQQHAVDRESLFEQMRDFSI